VAEAADALDGDHGARGRVGVAKRIEHRDPRAQQRCGFDRVHRLRDPDETGGAGVHHLGVAAVFARSGLGLVEAVHEIAAPALCALTAMATEEAKANAFADVPRRHASADRVDHADDLVAGDHRLAGIGTDAFDPKEIAVAHPAGEDTDADMAGFGIDDLALDEFELTLTGDLKSAIRRHGDP
jgi:hypothetical protein